MTQWTRVPIFASDTAPTALCSWFHLVVSPSSKEGLKLQLVFQLLLPSQVSCPSLLPLACVAFWILRIPLPSLLQAIVRQENSMSFLSIKSQELDWGPRESSL